MDSIDFSANQWRLVSKARRQVNINLNFDHFNYSNQESLKFHFLIFRKYFWCYDIVSLAEQSVHCVIEVERLMFRIYETSKLSYSLHLTRHLFFQ